MDWPQGCEKVILLITDAPSHTSTTTKDAAYAAMEAAEVGQFYGLTYTTQPRVRIITRLCQNWKGWKHV